MKSQQRGVSLIGLIILGIIIVLVATVGMRVFPTVAEYLAISKTVRRVAAGGGTTVLDIQRQFDKALAVEDITSISGKDLVVTKDGDRIVVEFEYKKIVPVFGPVSLLIEYKGDSRGR